MLKISEFSYLSSMSIHMLRHYDKIGLLRPKHIDDENGYRYYDKNQLVEANQINGLKQIGYNLDEIKKFMAMTSQKKETFFEIKREEKLKELQHIQSQINQIEVIQKSDQQSQDYAITMTPKQLDSMWVVSYRKIIKSYPQEGELWGILEKESRTYAYPLRLHGIAMAIYHQQEEDNIDVEVQLPLQKKALSQGNLIVKHYDKRDVVSVVFGGSYSQIKDINIIIARWLDKHKYKIDGPIFSMYHSSPKEVQDKKMYVTELCVPIKK